MTSKQKYVRAFRDMEKLTADREMRKQFGADYASLLEQVAQARKEDLVFDAEIKVAQK